MSKQTRHWIRHAIDALIRKVKVVFVDQMTEERRAR